MLNQETKEQMLNAAIVDITSGSIIDVADASWMSDTVHWRL